MITIARIKNKLSCYPPVALSIKTANRFDKKLMLLGFNFKEISCWSLSHIFPIQNPSEVRERGKKKHRQSNCLSNTLNKI